MCLLTKRRVGSSHDVALSIYDYILGFLAWGLEDCYRLHVLIRLLRAWRHAADGNHRSHCGGEERLLVGDVCRNNIQGRFDAGLLVRRLRHPYRWMIQIRIEDSRSTHECWKAPRTRNADPRERPRRRDPQATLQSSCRPTSSPERLDLAGR